MSKLRLRIRFEHDAVVESVTESKPGVSFFQFPFVEGPQEVKAGTLLEVEVDNIKCTSRILRRTDPDA